MPTEKMESSEDLFSKICRLCLSINNSGTVPLFGSDGNQSCFSQAIFLCTNVEVPKLEYAPNNMCYSCLQQLRQCILFQRRCKHAQTYFKTISLNGNLKNIKENIIKQLYRDRVLINDSKYDNSGVDNDKDGVNNEKNCISVINNDKSDVNNYDSGKNNDKEEGNHEKNYNSRINNDISVVNNEKNDNSVINNDKTAINNDINASSKGKSKQNNDMIHKYLEFDIKIEHCNKNNDMKNDISYNEINDFFDDQDSVQNEKVLNFIEIMIERDEIDNIKQKNCTNMISESNIIKKVRKNAIKPKKHIEKLSKKETKLQKRKPKTIKEIDNKKLELELFKLITEDSETIRDTKRKMSKYLDKIEKLISLNPRKKAEKLDPNMKVICDLCNKVFKDKKNLKLHLDLRHGTKQCICEFCGKACATRSEIEVHKLLSHGAGRHIPCDVCGHKAPSAFDLKEHMRIHTGERPFTCDKCGLTFRRQYVWKQHQIYHTEKTVQCPKCPRKFHTVSAMRSHDNTTHERKNLFTCPVCAKSYAQNKTVRRHLKEVHKIPRDKQGK